MSSKLGFLLVFVNSLIALYGLDRLAGLKRPHAKTNSIHTTTSNSKVPVLADKNHYFSSQPQSTPNLKKELSNSTLTKTHTLTLKSHLTVETTLALPLSTVKRNPSTPIDSLGAHLDQRPNRNQANLTYVVPIYLGNLFKEVLSGGHIPLPVTILYDPLSPNNPHPISHDTPHEISYKSAKTPYEKYYYSKEELITVFKTLNIPLNAKQIIGRGITLIISPPHHTASEKLLKSTSLTSDPYKKSKKELFPEQPKSIRPANNKRPPPPYRFYVAKKWEPILRSILEPNFNARKYSTLLTPKIPPSHIPTQIKRTHNKISLSLQGTLITDTEKIAFTTPQMKKPKQIPVAIIGYNIFFNKEP